MARSFYVPVAFIILGLIYIRDASAKGELEAEEIMSQIEIPDDDGTGGKTIDELIRDASQGDIQSVTTEGEVVVDLDMTMKPQQYNALFGQDKSTFSGAGLTNKARRWPKGILPYVMQDDFQGYEKNVYSAMKEWMEKTCIIFTPKGSQRSKSTGHSYYINISGGGRGCSSGLGFTKRNHQVSLSVVGCANHGTSLHELGHSIGLAHEQQRIDRDKYLKVIEENAFDKMSGAFAVNQETSTFDMPYDYCSVMHYGPYSFSKHGVRKMTIITKNPNYQFTIGQPAGRKHLSFGDAKLVNLMYDCNKDCPKSSGCKEPCYIDNKCQCQCPTPCAKKPCRDYQSKKVCQELKSQCNRINYANIWCAETCGVCDYVKKARGNDVIPDDGSGIGPVVPPTPSVQNVQGVPGPKCRDTQGGCSFFASRSSCKSNADIMKTCPKSCKLCSPCKDKHVYCEEFAGLGKCDFDTRFMYQDCKISCGLCK